LQAAAHERQDSKRISSADETLRGVTAGVCLNQHSIGLHPLVGLCKLLSTTGSFSKHSLAPSMVAGHMTFRP